MVSFDISQRRLRLVSLTFFFLPGRRRVHLGNADLLSSERHRLGSVASLPFFPTDTNKFPIIVLMTLGPGLMSLVKYNSPKHAWVPLYVATFLSNRDVR